MARQPGRLLVNLINASGPHPTQSIIENIAPLMFAALVVDRTRPPAPRSLPRARGVLGGDGPRQRRGDRGGGGGLGLYLAGGAGVFIWGMPTPASVTDADLGFRTAAGLEYQTSARRGLFLEWGQFWAFHQHSGVKSNTAKFGQIRGGLKIGW